MSYWILGELAVQSGGKSSDKLTEREIAEGAAHFSYGPPPGCWTVDPQSDWTIHSWMLEMAKGTGLTLVTDYEAKDSDIPKAIHDYVSACESAADVSDRVY